jgi:type IV pilus assembly protein PilA
MKDRRQRSRERGFTLAELMAVVVIVAVLATLAVIGVRKYIYAAKSSEAVNMIGSIESAEEAFKDETFAYLDVSGNLTSYYPMTTPGRVKYAWDNPSGYHYSDWQELGVKTNEPVQFGYAVKAGATGDAVPQPGTSKPFTWPTTTEPWFVVKAVGDQNGDGVQSIFVGSSFTSEIYSENESQ